MLSAGNIIWASIIIGLVWFLLDSDFNRWICISIYAFANMFIFALFNALGLMIAGYSLTFATGLAIVLTMLADFVLYFLIGIGVIYMMENLKGTEPKMAIGVGIITQFIIEVLISSLTGNIINLV